MKSINPYSTLGDTLSTIKFNFTCLDIQTCNLQYNSNAWNKLSISLNWLETFTESSQMSSNWESVATLVNNVSAYWNSPHTMIYPNVFPEGQVSKDQIEAWLNENFPASSYIDDSKFIIFFFEWYKTPALHGSPGQSLARFGLLTAENNVHVKRVGYTSFISRNDKWIRVDLLHFPKTCIDETCFSCFGVRELPDYPICWPPIKYWQLECVGDVSEETVDEPVENWCLSSNMHIDWYWPTSKEELQSYSLYVNLSSTDIPPYTINIVRNPELDEISEGLYKYYINDNSKPIRFNAVVDRHMDENVLFHYTWNTTTEEFDLSSKHPENNGIWNLTANVDHFYNFNIEHLYDYMYHNGKETVLLSACPFAMYIDTTWYRWVSNEINDITATPYWHIGIDPLSSMGISGFDLDPSTPDPVSAWNLAVSLCGESLSAFFGLEEDTFGIINNIVILPLTATYSLTAHNG